MSDTTISLRCYKKLKVSNLARDWTLLQRNDDFVTFSLNQKRFFFLNAFVVVKEQSLYAKIKTRN